MPRKKQGKKTSPRARRKRGAKGKAIASTPVSSGRSQSVMPFAYTSTPRKYIDFKKKTINVGGKMTEVLEIRACEPYINILEGTGSLASGFAIGPFSSINNTIVTITSTEFFGRLPLMVMNPAAAPTPATTVSPAGLPAGSFSRTLASTFNRYRYTRVVLKYQPRVNTVQLGSFMFGYHPDGAAANTNQISVPDLESLPLVTNTPVWLPAELDISSALDSNWFFVQYSGGPTPAEAELRLTMQGTILGRWLDPTVAGPYPALLGAVTGFLWMEYTLELRDPSIPTNIQDDTPNPGPLPPSYASRVGAAVEPLVVEEPVSPMLVIGRGRESKDERKILETPSLSSRSILSDKLRKS